MEAISQNICEKINIKNPEKLKSESKYTIISDKNNNFTVFIKNYINYIEINATNQIDEFKKNEFVKEYNLSELKVNKFLSICESIDDIYDELIFEISKNKFILKENNENKIDIIIPVNRAKIKEISFILDKKVNTTKEEYQELYNIIYSFNDKIKTITKEKDEIIVNNEKEINKLKNMINENFQYFNKKIENLEKEIGDLKNENINLNNKNNLILEENKKYSEMVKQYISNNTFEEVYNPWTEEKDPGPTIFTYKLSKDNFLAKTDSDFIYYVKGKHKFLPNKKYKLIYNTCYNNDVFRIGFGDYKNFKFEMMT